MTAITEPGVYDISEAEYFGATGALSCSGAKLLLPPNCPALFRYRQDHPEHKDVFDFGSAAHKIVLGAGPELAVIEFDTWQTNAARQERDAARAKGMIPLLFADYIKVKAMAEAIRAHPDAGPLLDPDRGGVAEQSLFWEDEETGVPRRCRIDWRRGRIAADYKSCAKADPDSIRKAITSYGYFQQDPYYCDGIEALGLASDPAFVFVFQEKTPPYLVNVAQLDPENPANRAAGAARNRRAIERFRDCTETGIWPGYEGDTEDGITYISLPPWAARTLEASA